MAPRDACLEHGDRGPLVYFANLPRRRGLCYRFKTFATRSCLVTRRAGRTSRPLAHHIEHFDQALRAHSRDLSAASGADFHQPQTRPFSKPATASSSPFRRPLKEWLKPMGWSLRCEKNVAHVCRIGLMAVEAIVRKWLKRGGKSLLIRFHCGVCHLAGTNGPATYDSIISRVSKIPVETGSKDSPRCACHDVVVANVTAIKHPANIVVYRNDLTVRGGHSGVYGVWRNAGSCSPGVPSYRITGGNAER